jgi:hypothetical protein
MCCGWWCSEWCAYNLQEWCAEQAKQSGQQQRNKLPSIGGATAAAAAAAAAGQGPSLGLESPSAPSRHPGAKGCVVALRAAPNQVRIGHVGGMWCCRVLRAFGRVFELGGKQGRKQVGGERAGKFFCVPLNRMRFMHVAGGNTVAYDKVGLQLSVAAQLLEGSPVRHPTPAPSWLCVFRWLVIILFRAHAVHSHSHR